MVLIYVNDKKFLKIYYFKVSYFEEQKKKI